MDWSRFWFAPALFAGAVMVCFMVLFWEKSVKGGKGAQVEALP